ncbi:hypothetical protein PILCRDRAFT_819031 [Piloderma croceum F 1598]|uniref:Uncharacterized protein n=1 Tax=Piloderma croceum (strain F 1598) TaxID=765440 RepID=A0A0C3FHX1_PILCF|nr:hypothetical protein PILCRDRAFT_819031 [Piloderma croceum F 1598]
MYNGYQAAAPDFSAQNSSGTSAVRVNQYTTSRETSSKENGVIGQNNYNFKRTFIAR